MGKKDDEIDVDDDMFDDDMDFDFDDDFDFDSRTPAGPKKYAVAFGKGMGVGVKNRIVDEAAKNMPNTASAVDEAFDVLSELDDIKDEVKESMSSIGREAKKLVRPTLPVLKRVLPTSWYNKLDEATTPEEKIKQQTAEQIKTQKQEDTITGAVAELFQQQTAQTEKAQAGERVRDQMHQSERLVDLQRDNEQHDASQVSLQHIRRELAVANAFHSSSSLAYMKKSIELKYRHMFLTQDLVEASRASFRFSETAMNKIIVNTQLPESQKIMMGERWKNMTKDKFAGQFNEMIAKFIPTMLGNVRKQIKNPMEMIRTALSEASGMVDQADGMGMDMKEMGAEIAGGSLGKKLVNRPVEWLAGMFGDKFMDAETLTGNYKKKLYGELSGAKRKLAGSDGFFGQMGHKLLESILPTHSTKRGISLDEAYKNPEAPAEFDVSVRQAIVDVIPGYQAMQLQKTTELANHLMGVRAPVEMTAWDAKTRRFKSASALATDYIDDVYNVSSIQNAYDRGMGTLEGQHRLAGKDQESFKHIQSDLKRFMVNVGVETIDSEMWSRIRTYATNDKDLASSPKMIQQLFKGTKDPKQLAQYIWDFQLKPDGKVDHVKRNTFVNIAIEMNEGRDSKADQVRHISTLPGSHLFRDQLLDVEAVKKGKHLTDGSISTRDLDNEVFGKVLGQSTSYSQAYRQGALGTLSDNMLAEEAKETRNTELYELKRKGTAKPKVDADDWRDREIQLMQEALADTKKFDYGRMRDIHELTSEYEQREAVKDPDLKRAQRDSISEILASQGTTPDVVEPVGPTKRSFWKPKGKVVQQSTDTVSDKGTTRIVTAIKEFHQSFDRHTKRQVDTKPTATTTTATVDLSATNQHLVDIKDLLVGQTNTTTGLLSGLHSAITDMRLFNYHGGDSEAAKGIWAKVKGAPGWTLNKGIKGYGHLSNFSRTAMETIVKPLPALAGNVLTLPVKILQSVNKSIYGENEDGSAKKNVLMETMTSGLAMPWKIFNKTKEKIKGSGGSEEGDDVGTGLGGFLKRAGSGIGGAARGIGGGIKSAVEGAGKGIKDIAGQVLPPSMVMGLEAARLGGHGLLNVGRGVKNLFTGGGGSTGTNRIVGRLDTIITLMGGTPPADDVVTDGGGRVAGVYQRLKSAVQSGATDTTDDSTTPAKTAATNLKTAVTSAKDRVVDSVKSRTQQLRERMGIGTAMEFEQKKAEVTDRILRTKDTVDEQAKSYLDKLYRKLEPNSDLSEEEQLQALAEYEQFSSGGYRTKAKSLLGKIKDKFKRGTDADPKDEKAEKASGGMLTRFARRIGGRFGKMAALVGLRKMTLEDTMKAQVLATMNVGTAVEEQGGGGGEDSKKGGFFNRMKKGGGWMSKAAGLVVGAAKVTAGLTAGAAIHTNLVGRIDNWRLNRSFGEGPRTFLNDYSDVNVYYHTRSTLISKMFGKANSFITSLCELLGVPFSDDMPWFHKMVTDTLTSFHHGRVPTEEDAIDHWNRVAKALGFKRKSKQQRDRYVTWFGDRFIPILQEVTRSIEGYNEYLQQEGEEPLDYMALLKMKDRDRKLELVVRGIRTVKVPDDIKSIALTKEYITAEPKTDTDSSSTTDVVEDDTTKKKGWWARAKEKLSAPASTLATSEPEDSDSGDSGGAGSTGTDSPTTSIKDRIKSTYAEIRDRAKAWLKGHEGLRLNKYTCTAGKPTIGFGHHMQDRQFDSVTLQEAEQLFEMDYAQAESLAQQIPVFSKLDGVRQAALVNMVFNMGLGSKRNGKGVLGFNKALSALDAAATVDDTTKSNQLFDQAAREILSSNYAKQTGDRAKEVATVLKSGDPNDIRPKSVNVAQSDRAALSNDDMQSLSQQQYQEYINKLADSKTTEPTTAKSGGLANLVDDTDPTKAEMSTAATKRPTMAQTTDTEDDTVVARDRAEERYTTVENKVDVHAELMEGEALVNNTRTTNDLLSSLSETMRQFVESQVAKSKEEERRRVVEERRRPYLGQQTASTPTSVRIPLPT